MIDPIVPRPDTAVGRGIDALVARRPSALAHIDEGRYGHLFAGWRAQVAVLVQRLVAEIGATRLPLATGQALRELCASEFETELPDDPRAALGDVTLRRSAGLLPAGVIRRGTRWRRPADPANALVPAIEAAYVSVADVVVRQGATDVTCTLRATRTGAFANTVVGPGPLELASGANTIQPVDALFDPNLAPVVGLAAGGADGTSDELLRTAARAYALGRYAPTLGAIAAAALRAGVPHVSAFDAPATASTIVLACDVSWGTSRAWAMSVEQQIRDTFEGFGCRARVLPAQNTFIRVECTVMLRDASFLVDTTDITAALGSAVRVYFDLRADWYTWRLGALRGLCSRAHRRILACTSVVVRDAVTSEVLSEPTFNPRAAVLGGKNVPYHYFLSDNAIQPTYLVPR